MLGLPVLAGWSISLQDLDRIGAELGSDVPFFLLGGAAVALGRGTELYPLPEDEEEYGDGSYAEYQEEAEAEAPAEADGGDTPANGDEDEAR